jgi:hypothetical protein
MAEPSRNDGTGLESRFAKWLLDVHGFHRVEQRQRIRGRISTEVYEVDVLAERYRYLLWTVSRWGWPGFGWAVVIEVLYAFIFNEIPPTALVVSSVAFLLAGGVADKYKTTSVWAECKDIKASVGRETVAILKHHVDDVRNNTTGWKPTHIYLVTSGRFEQNALRLAYAYGFTCYEESATGFERVDPPIACW